MRTPLLSFSLAVVVVGCGGGGGGYGGSVTTPTTPTTPAAPTATTSVAMQNTAFNPQDIVVSPGATVTWTNNDGINHNVTFANASTGDFSSGSQSLVMPTATGTYNYSCTIHRGMTGTVKVQ
jgi:plastocyanin